MEGYSVTEAASVLGVPTERVWELLARGVLSGAAEGETGMRVYLQPRPAPAPVEPKGPNGNGGAHEPERELSPFRELLTEFRNLTERYGQALLALGEARGEVAALRSRVDLLEARMDLRLPMAPSPASGWTATPMPAPIERAVMPARDEVATDVPVEAPSDAPAAAEVEHEPTEEERRTRARGPRRATESFAEALARAEDPSPPELPGGTESAAAIAALRQPSEATADIDLPREVASADAIPVADTDDALVRAEAAPVEAADEAEAPVELPHATFEPLEDPVPLVEAAQTEPPPYEAMATDGAMLEARVEPKGATFEPELEPAPQPDAEPEPIPFEAEEVAEAEVPEVVAQPMEAAVELAPEEAEAEPVAWDAERYTTAIDEPDWLAAEVAEATDETPTTDDAPSPRDPAPADVDSAPEVALGDGAPADATPADATKISADQPEPGSGADEMEVAPSAIQPQETRPSATQAFPGSRDLEDAIAALRAAGRVAEPPAEGRPEAAQDVATDTDEWPPRSNFARPSPPPAGGTHGSASRAYRRLRRIFPG